MRLVSLLALLACDAPPEACAQACAAAAVAMQGCLAEDGLGWEAAGYADEAAFLDACDTWAWEQLQLAREAGQGRAALGEACEVRAEDIEQGTCEEFMALDWNHPLDEVSP